MNTMIRLPYDGFDIVGQCKHFIAIKQFELTRKPLIWLNTFGDSLLTSVCSSFSWAKRQNVLKEGYHLQ